MSKVYENLPGPIIEAGENVLRAYTEGTVPTADRGLLRTVEAMLFAEAAALEAVDLLATRQGSSTDLLFAELLEEPVFAPLAPAMLSMLRFLRARIAGQDAVLRLDPNTPEPALSLLLLAGQALVSAADDHPGTDRVCATLTECLRRLAVEPAETRYPSGDLAFGLTEDAEADEETLYIDEVRKVLHQAVPLRRVLPAPGRTTAFLVLDLSARGDVADLLRILATDPPADGADTSTIWRAFAGTDASLIRLEVEWLQPVPTSLAVVLDVDEHGPALRAITRADHVQLSATDPLEQQSNRHIHAIRVPTNGPALNDLLTEVARQRR